MPQPPQFTLPALLMWIVTVGLLLTAAAATEVHRGLLWVSFTLALWGVYGMARWRERLHAVMCFAYAVVAMLAAAFAYWLGTVTL